MLISDNRSKTPFYYLKLKSYLLRHTLRYLHLPSLQLCVLVTTVKRTPGLGTRRREVSCLYPVVKILTLGQGIEERPLRPCMFFYFDTDHLHHLLFSFCPSVFPPPSPEQLSPNLDVQQWVQISQNRNPYENSPPPFLIYLSLWDGTYVHFRLLKLTGLHSPILVKKSDIRVFFVSLFHFEYMLTDMFLEFQSLLVPIEKDSGGTGGKD